MAVHSDELLHCRSMQRSFSTDHIRQYFANVCKGRMSSSDDSEDLALSIVIAKHQKSKKRTWSKDWLRRHEQKGSYCFLFQELRKDSEFFSKYMRLSPMFQKILDKVSSKIPRENTVLRNSVSAGARLEAIMLYLSSGLNYSRLQYQTMIHHSTLSLIIPETCDAIFDALKDDALKNCI